MKVSERALELIKKYEGYSPQAYKCPAGIWTIGYGHTRTTTPNSIITRAKAEKLLIEDVAQSERYINNLQLDLRQSQFDALVSFVFNVGIGHFMNSTLLKKIEYDRDDPKIADEFCRWIYIKSKRNAGLYNRRVLEAKLYFLDKD